MDTHTYNRLLDFLNWNWNKVYNLPNVPNPSPNPGAVPLSAPIKLVGGMALNLLTSYAEKTVPQYIVGLEHLRNSMQTAKKVYPLEYRREVVVAYNTLIKEILTLFPNPTIQMTDEDLHPLLQEDTTTHDGSLDTDTYEEIHAEVSLNVDDDDGTSHVCISGGIGNTLSAGDLEYNIVMLEPAQALSLLAWLSLNRKTLEELVHKQNEEQ